MSLGKFQTLHRPRHYIKSIITSSLFLLFLLSPASAKVYFAAPGGSDDNTGTLETPFATITRGQTIAVAGDTIYFRGGNGNGFKAGGYGLPPTNVPANPPKHIVRNCVAFLNRASGFYANHHPVAGYWYNNTGYNNKSANFNMQGVDISSTDYPAINVGILRNNITFTGTAIANGTGSGIDAASNTWNLSTLTVSAVDFQSIDTAGIYDPRKPDGSLPEIKFLKLAPGSDLIDKGANVGLPYSDAAPDLGAFETGATGVIEPYQPGAVTHSGAATIFTTAKHPVFDLSGRSVFPVQNGKPRMPTGVYISTIGAAAGSSGAYHYMIISP